LDGLDEHKIEGEYGAKVFERRERVTWRNAKKIIEISMEHIVIIMEKGALAESTVRRIVLFTKVGENLLGL